MGFLSKIGGAVSSLGKSLTGSLGGAIGGAIGTFADGMIGDYFNRKSQEREYNYALRMWNKENEYNLPINQMKRFEEAGLNPNLIYGQQNTAGSIGNGPSGYAFRADSAGYLQKYYGIKNMKEQNRNLQEQNALLQSQASVQRVQAEKAKLEIDFFKKHNYWPSQEGGWSKELRQFLGLMSTMINAGRPLNSKGQPLLVKGKKEGDYIYPTMDGRYFPVRY